MTRANIVPSELQTTAKTCYITRTYTCVLKDKFEVHRTHEARKITFSQLFLTRFVKSISEQHVSETTYKSLAN